MLSVVLFLASVSLHLRHLAGSMGWRDAAELCSSASTLGIAHPTGYPLYVTLGRAACLLPLGDVPFRAALVSVLCQAGTVLCVYKLLRKVKVGAPAAVLSALLSGGLALFRDKAVQCEVYPLFLLLLTAAVWALVARPRGSLWAFLLGAAATAHLTAVLMFPGLLYLAWRKDAFPRDPFRLFSCLLLGAALVLFLPIRSEAEPVRAWADLGSPVPLFEHLAGTAYHHRMKGLSLVRMAVQGRRLLGVLSEPAALPLVLAPLAWIHWCRSRRGLAAAALFSCLPLLLFYLAYDTTDIADFAPHAFPLALFVCVSAGIGADRLGRGRASLLVNGAALLCASLPFFVPPKGSGRRDLSTEFFFVPAIRVLPRAAAVFTAGDNTTFYLWYARQIEERRQDLIHAGLQAGRNVAEVSPNVPNRMAGGLTGKPWPQAARRLLAARIPVFLEPGVHIPPEIASELHPRDAWWTATQGTDTQEELLSFRRRVDRLFLSQPGLTLNRDFAVHLGTLANGTAEGLAAAGEFPAAAEHLRWAVRVCPSLPELRYNLRYLESGTADFGRTPHLE